MLSPSNIQVWGGNGHPIHFFFHILECGFFCPRIAEPPATEEEAKGHCWPRLRVGQSPKSLSLSRPHPGHFAEHSVAWLLPAGCPSQYKFRPEICFKDELWCTFYCKPFWLPLRKKRGGNVLNTWGTFRRRWSGRPGQYWCQKTVSWHSRATLCSVLAS